MACCQERSTDKYSLRKVHDCWFLENSNTGKTRRLPFLSTKLKITLGDNLIFADDNVYKIKETDSGIICIEKIEDLIYSTGKEAERVSSTPVCDKENMYEFVSSTKNDIYETSTVNTGTGFEKSSDFHNEDDGMIKSFRDVNIRSYECGSAEYVEGGTGGLQLQTQGSAEYNTPQSEATATFQVLIEDTKLSELCGLREKMELRVNKSGFSFYDTKGKSATYIFSNRWVRRFGQHGIYKYSFDVGRRCPAGEGEVLFTTDGKTNVYNTIKRIWYSDVKR